MSSVLLKKSSNMKRTPLSYEFMLITLVVCNFIVLSFGYSDSPDLIRPFDIHHGHHQSSKNDLDSYRGGRRDHEDDDDDDDDTEYFDLTYTFDEDSIFYPGQRYDFHLLRDVGPTINVTSDRSYRYSYASYSFCMSEHGGTHIDAPLHFNKFGWRLAEIPIKRLVNVPIVVVDVEHHVFALRRPDEFILEVEHLVEHESKFGKIPRGSVVLVNYGWGKFWPDKQRYTGWDNSTSPRFGEETYTLNFPGMSGLAASWLVKERQIVGFGSDTMSADAGNVKDSVVHIILLENQVYIIENVAYLDNLLRKTRQHNYHQSNPSCKLRSHVLPIKTLGTGGPVRLVAYCS